MGLKYYNDLIWGLQAKLAKWFNFLEKTLVSSGECHHAEQRWTWFWPTWKSVLLLHLDMGLSEMEYIATWQFVNSNKHMMRKQSLGTLESDRPIHYQHHPKPGSSNRDAWSTGPCNTTNIIKHRPRFHAIFGVRTPHASPRLVKVANHTIFVAIRVHRHIVVTLVQKERQETCEPLGSLTFHHSEVRQDLGTSSQSRPSMMGLTKSYTFLHQLFQTDPRGFEPDAVQTGGIVIRTLL